MSRRIRNKQLRVMTYNIHQGMTAYRRQIALSTLKDAIKSLKIDLVLLQEVAGVHSGRKRSEKMPDHSVTPFQLEALADAIWPYSAFGRNSVFSGGFHGNAILSKFPIRAVENTDLSLVKGLVKRGLLHAEIELGGRGFHVLCTHLGLLEAERTRQVKRVVDYIEAKVPAGLPLVLGGDFNDWRERVSRKLSRDCKLDEAFLKQDRKHARTFPSQMPLLRLDRVYFRGMKVTDAIQVQGRPWLFLSDHLPLVVEFSLP
jgi:endonuclease/exonuclease/phosphatase family metal-dependent hydrolase